MTENQEILKAGVSRRKVVFIVMVLLSYCVVTIYESKFEQD